MPSFEGRVFDWIPRFDNKSRNHPIRELLTVDQTEPRTYSWPCTARLDQGTEGRCVGYAWAHELSAAPIRIPVTNALANIIYHSAQLVDEWDGENYDGTSVLAGAKAVTNMAFMPKYRWAFGLKDVLLTLSWKGPVVLGIPWYEGMMRPNSDGFIRPTGQVVGGHAIIARAIALTNKYVTLRNSWGASWGLNGDCKLSFDDLEWLLDQNGEACIPLKRLNSAA